MYKFSVTFTIDIFSADKEESFQEAEYQLKNKSYDMDDINIQSSECTDEKEYE